MTQSPAGRRYLVGCFAAALAVGGAAAVSAGATAAPQAAKGTVAAAKAAVAQHAARLGFGPGQSLVVKAVYHASYGDTVRFDRTYRGLPLVNGDFVVHLDKAGHYQYAEGRRVSGLPASISPTLSRSAALAATATTLGYQVKSFDARLAVFSSRGGSTLAWQVATAGVRADKGDVTYVSARNGSTLASWPTVDSDSVKPNHKDTGTGHTLYSGTVVLQDVKKHHVYTLTDKTRGKQTVYDAHDVFSESGTAFSDSNNVWGNGTTSSRETAGADAAYGIAETWDYYLNVFGRHGIADDGVAARGFVHYGSGYRNANWDDGCFCMLFGDGSGDWGPLVSLDVAGHEMTHGVTSRTAGLVYSGESGGLNESTSDVFGTQVEWYADNAEDVPDYMIGEEFNIPYDPEHNYLRRMDDPHQDGLSADCWYNGVGNLDVHYSSGVGNHLFYLLAEGSGSKTINGLAYNSPTCDQSTLTGIGHDKAAAIWFQALTHHWVSTTNYHTACTGLQTSAQELYGAGSTEYNATVAACHAVNIS